MEFDGLDVIAEEVLSETKQTVNAERTMEEAWEDVRHEYPNILAIEVPLKIDELSKYRHILERYVKVVMKACCIKCSHTQWFLSTSSDYKLDLNVNGSIFKNKKFIPPDNITIPDYVILLGYISNKLPENTLYLRIGFEYNRNMVDFLRMLLEIRKIWKSAFYWIFNPTTVFKGLWFYVNSNNKGYYDIRNTLFDRTVPFDNFEIDYFDRIFKEICPGRPDSHDMLKLSDDPQIQLTYWWANYVEKRSENI
jgi:hypothetical protein